VLSSVFCCLMTVCHSLSSPSLSRRAVFVQTSSSVVAAASTAGLVTGGLVDVDKAFAADLTFETSSGIQWADAKIGSGVPFKLGSTTTIDYVMSTTGARYGAKIYSTQDSDTPYRWILGDGSTIAGIEQAILGDGGSLKPMLPGGIRRVIIPQSLGYTKLAEQSKTLCVENGHPGPIPSPKDAFEEYQRFKNIYCNSERQYQPDLVMDIKLYGQRTKQ
jgi:hypothetical protein